MKTPSTRSRIWPRHTGRSVIFYAVCKRPWTLCEKVGSRCPPSASPPGTKLGTVVDGVGGLRADRPARPSRPCLRRTGGAKIGLPLQWGLAPLILGKRLVWFVYTYKTGFHLSRMSAFAHEIRPHMSMVTTTYIRLWGGGEGCCGQHACARAHSTARKSQFTGRP